MVIYGYITYMTTCSIGQLFITFLAEIAHGYRLVVFVGDFVAANLMGIRPTILRIEAVKMGIMVQDGAPKIAEVPYKWLSYGLW